MVMVAALWVVEATAERQRHCCDGGYSRGSGGIDR
jgi:hypothetical protein